MLARQRCDLLLQTFAQGRPQRREPLQLCFVPTGVALASDHLGNNERSTARLASNRACNVCSALQTIKIAIQNKRKGDHFEPPTTGQWEKNCPGNHFAMASLRP